MSKRSGFTLSTFTLEEDEPWFCCFFGAIFKFNECVRFAAEYNDDEDSDSDVPVQLGAIGLRFINSPRVFPGFNK